MKIKIALIVLLVISLCVNAIFYFKSIEPRVSSLSTPRFIVYDDRAIVTASGYLKWNDPKHRSSVVRQFFHIEATSGGGKQKCQLLDVWDWTGRSVAIGETEECEVTQFDRENKWMTISYKDAIFTISESEATFQSLNKAEGGGGILVPGYKL